MLHILLIHRIFGSSYHNKKLLLIAFFLCKRAQEIAFHISVVLLLLVGTVV